jgi:phosphatidylserine decarboxylase
MKRRPRALYEGRWIFLILGLCWGTLLFFHALIPGVFFAALILFCVNFFRDPERIPPPDPPLAVAPADGTVTLVDECVEEQYLKRRMKRISIFLSVFDVHVNRTPVAGEVLFTEGRGGLYLDARHPEASRLNESLLWIIGSKEDPDRAVAVKQITGAIARRIVPWAVVGEKLERGERFGMIRFGSRTDLYLPLDAEILVSAGQKVLGGETPVARIVLLKPS